MSYVPIQVATGAESAEGADVSDQPTRKILTTRTELDTLGHSHLVATLNCGHEVITKYGETEASCVQCRDEERFGTPRADAPRES